MVKKYICILCCICKSLFTCNWHRHIFQITCTFHLALLFCIYWQSVGRVSYINIYKYEHILLVEKSILFLRLQKRLLLFFYLLENQCYQPNIILCIVFIDNLNIALRWKYFKQQKNWTFFATLFHDQLPFIHHVTKLPRI